MLAGLARNAAGTLQNTNGMPRLAKALAMKHLLVLTAAIGAAGCLAAVAASGLLSAYARLYQPSDLTGTRIGNGCTSGHGVCGLSRMSSRSLASVVTFMAVGAIVAVLVGKLTGGAA